MASHNMVGTAGEKMAADWLRARGYEILHRNWRHSRYELDIIAKKGDLLHFIEVKTRSGSRYGFPEEFVGRKKFRNIQRAADEFLFLHPGYRWIQFDILSITLWKDSKPAIFLVEDVS